MPLLTSSAQWTRWASPSQPTPAPGSCPCGWGSNLLPHSTLDPSYQGSLQYTVSLLLDARTRMG